MPERELPALRMVLAKHSLRKEASQVLEDLRVILEAEADAHRQFDAARGQAAEIVRQAEMEAQEQVRAARDARENEAAAVEERLVVAAEQQAARILATADATAAALQAQAADRLERAVDALVKAVVGPPAPGASDGR